MVNKDLRAAAKRILGSIVPRDEESDAVLTWVLRRAALRRLGEVGVVGHRAEGVLDQEPGLGNLWLAYLALAPESVIGGLVSGDISDVGSA